MSPCDSDLRIASLPGVAQFTSLKETQMIRYRLNRLAPLLAAPVAVFAFVLAGTQPIQAGPTQSAPKGPKPVCTTGPQCGPTVQAGIAP